MKSTSQASRSENESPRCEAVHEDTSMRCDLRVGHDGAHSAQKRTVAVVWATEEQAQRMRRRLRELGVPDA